MRPVAARTICSIFPDVAGVGRDVKVLEEDGTMR